MEVLAINLINKFKIGLIGEVILFFSLSIILTILIITIAVSKLNISRINYPYSSNESLLISYNQGLKKNIDEFINKNIDNLSIPHKLDSELKDAFPVNHASSLSNYQELIIAIVNNKGELLNSNTGVSIINSEIDYIDLTVFFENNSSNSISTFYEDKLNIISFNPKNNLKVVYNDDDKIQIKETRKINDNLYLIVVKRTVFTNSLVVILGIAFFITIFTLLTRGRLKYILFLKKEIGTLYSSKFEKKITLKYNNELTALAIALNDMAQIVWDSQKNEEEFILNISHDLRTPLTSIIGFLELIKQKKYSEPEEQDRYLVIIQEKSLYLKTLIDEFFEYSKYKNTNVDLVKERINLQEILRQVSDSYYPLLNKKDLILNFKFPEETIFLDVDIDKFIRAIENILFNAVKYSKKDTEIIIILYKKEETISIEFWNTPEDIVRKEDVHLFFKRFYKKDASRNSEGAGLGLSIALEIIRIHHGSIDVDVQDSKFGIFVKMKSHEANNLSDKNIL
ncbi:UNVERIFIED_CONTAM: signal transduction histidine kinase [Acetivibrio alkalicellulosi]